MDKYTRTYLRIAFICLLGLVALFSILVTGCRTVEYKNTVIRDTIVTIVPTIIRDTIQGYAVGDTVYIDRVNYQQDTIIKIRYATKTKQATVYVKPDTIRVFDRDTLTVYPVAPQPKSTQGNVWVAAGLLLIAGVLFYIYNKFKIKGV
jgi:hypothetical protein